MTKKSHLVKVDKPIGIFDSGIGGLTVLKEIRARLPAENIIYFGDTARVPYGIKSAETVTRFSKEIVEFLLQYDIKLIVVACNSASALALEELKRLYDVPMIGVITPGAKKAVEETVTKRVGVIGTRATVESGVYEREISKINREITVYSQPCPLFVSLVEEGWIDKEATKLIAKEYLHPLVESKIDVLVLGCTHYPLLKEVIIDIVGEGVRLVDSAQSCSIEVKKVLCEKRLLNLNNDDPIYSYYVSDMPERFQQVGERFLGYPIETVRLVSEL